MAVKIHNKKVLLNSNHNYIKLEVQTLLPQMQVHEDRNNESNPNGKNRVHENGKRLEQLEKLNQLT